MNGNRLCSSDSEPVRSAIADPIPPMPTAVSTARHDRAEHAHHAARIARAEQRRDREEQRHLEQRQYDDPAQAPEHEAGAVHGRGQQAVEEPELDVGRHRDARAQAREVMPCTIVPGTRNAR